MVQIADRVLTELICFRGKGKAHAMPLTIKCDLHIHSNFGDGKPSISEIVDLYGQNGFGAIASAYILILGTTQFIDRLPHCILK